MKLDVGFEELDCFSIEVNHPTKDEPIGGKDKPFTVELYALHSDYMKRFIDAMSDAKAEKAARLKKPAMANLGRKDILKIYAHAHKSWSNVPVESGASQPECNQQNALELMERYAWYRSFIGNELGNDGNTIKDATD